MKTKGGIEIFGTISSLATILFLGCCTTNSFGFPGQTVDPERPCAAGQIRFLVTDQDGPDLGGVQISAVTEEGIRALGVTDLQEADICLDTSILQDPTAFCLLFCREGYHFGALLPKKELLEYWELKIALARRMI